MEPSFLLIHIVDSTFHHLMNQMVPLSLQNGKRAASFPSHQHTRLYFHQADCRGRLQTVR